MTYAFQVTTLNLGIYGIHFIISYALPYLEILSLKQLMKILL